MSRSVAAVGGLLTGWLLLAVPAARAQEGCDFDLAVDCPDDFSVDAPPGVCAADVALGGLCNCSLPVPGSYPIGTFGVTCTDDFGDVCSFDITVRDTVPPQILCDPDSTQDNLAGQCGAIAAYNVIPSDDCAESPLVQCSVSSGDFVAVGTTAITCTATDGSGNTASCSRTETVVDVEPPVFPPLPDLTAQSPDGNPVAVAYGPVPVGDNCGATPLCAPTSGSLFPLGATTVTCNASDAAGNAATPASFLVTVLAALVAVPALGKLGMAGLALGLALASLVLLRR